MSIFGLKDYLRAQALSMKSRLKVIQDLILSKEEILKQQFPPEAEEFAEAATGLSKDLGHIAEVTVRALLRDVLPARFGVGTGFVFTGEQPLDEHQTNPLDVLIYDALNYSPVFTEGDYVVIPIHALLAVIEVKTTLTSQKYQEAVKQLEFLEYSYNLPTNPSGYVLGFTRKDSLDAVEGWASKYTSGWWMRGVYLVQDDWFQLAATGVRQVFPQDGLYHFYFRFLRELYTIVELAYPWPADILEGGE